MKPAKGQSRTVRSLQPLLLVGLGLFASKSAFAAEYYVAPTGSDSDPGTIDKPFGTLQKGADTAVAGDTVWIRGGTYAITKPKTSSAGILFSKSGTSDTNRIKYWAYPGEVPLVDFTNMTISTTGYTMGFSITGSWLHFKGIEECCVPMNTFSNNGFAVDSGSNDIFENLNMHHNSGNGIFIGSKSTGGHLVLNCDAHDNYDATSNQGQGQNADGFGVHYQTKGDSTTIRGCRAWWNSDDGYDLINQEVPVTVENSWAFGNGYADYGNTNPTDGNGNGFKMGSSKTGIRHLVQNNVAWKNKASGFYANHSSGGNTWYNNTSYSNGTQYNMLASDPNDSSVTITLTGSLVHIMRNNIGFPNKNTNMTGVDTAFNSWDLNLTPATKDFLSVTDPSMTVKDVSAESSGALGPRQADGSLPNVDFLKLMAGSQMIDKGTDVGLPFVGGAPDLGAYEFGATGGGGAAGTGGAPGTGGRPGSGGAVGSGGRIGLSGTGGASAVGGAVGSGGRSASSGGAPGNGGALSTAGKTGTGGTSGSAGTGGAVGAIGTVGLGGRGTNTDGGVATGGAIGSGAGATGAGGSVATGGASGSMQNAATASSGCSCRLANAQTASHPGFALFALLLFALATTARRQRRRR